MTQTKRHTDYEAASAAIEFYVVANKKLEFQGKQEKMPSDYEELNNALHRYKTLVPEDVRDQLREFVNVGKLEEICKLHL